MDDHRTDLWADLLFMLFFVAPLLGSWLVLRFTVHEQRLLAGPGHGIKGYLMEPTDHAERPRKPAPRAAAARPTRQKKTPPARAAPSHRLWRTRLVLLTGGLGLLLMAVVILRMDAQIKLQCRVQEQLMWERMPETMARQLLDNAREDARLQEALDTQRQTSWWAWLTTPAQPPKRGCDSQGFF